jgi:AraC family transcriptional regulator, regulatory protein of adaptative response / methylated-DNA-[protein]-cysteine methyltransferase
MPGMKRTTRNTGQMYKIMRDAIYYMREHVKDRPSIAEIAKTMGMSQSRFEHAFTEWAGTPPKRFLAYLAKEHAKSALTNSKDVLKAAHASGLSGPGRLHGLMVTHEAVSPGEFKTGKFEIIYGIHSSPFGKCLIGITKRGVCHLSFLDDGNEQKAINRINQSWPNAMLLKDEKKTAEYVKNIFAPGNKPRKRPIHLLIKGTNFQIKVWEALLAIPDGRLSNYSQIARSAGFPKAARAVGTACGNNSIAYLIPCHRVLTSSGGIGGYRWGTGRKEAILAWENVHFVSE